MTPLELFTSQIRNVGERPAIGLHSYRTDIEAQGTGVDHRFDLPIHHHLAGDLVTRRQGAPVA